MMPGTIQRSPKKRGESGMSTQEATWLAWYMCAVSWVMTAFALYFLVVSRSRMGAPLFDYWLLNTVIAVSFSPVGAMIAPRLPPRNPIGWLFCIVGLIGAARLRCRVRHRHAACGAGKHAAKLVAGRRSTSVDLFLGVGCALRAFHIPGTALPRR